MLLPFCTFKDNHKTIWDYRNVSNPELKVSKDFAYCSLFRDDYAIFGEYSGDPENGKILYGILDNDLKVIEPAIYDSLEFYPYKSFCFIGKLGTNFNYHEEVGSTMPFTDGAFHQKVIFNIEGSKFWYIGKEIIPINKDLFVVVNKPDKVNLHSSDGYLISELPFSISKPSPFDESKIVKLKFQIIEKSDDLIRLKYFHCEEQPGWHDSVIIGRCHMYYYYFFSVNGDFIGESEIEDAYKSQYCMKPGWRNNHENIQSIPSDVIPTSLDLVHSELMKNNLVYSKHKNPIEWKELFVFELPGGFKFWSPKTQINKIQISVDECINYGQFKGNTFIDIFEYNPGYIEWLITTNQFSFQNLNDFWKNGNPKKLSLNNISDFNKKKFMEYLKSNNKASKFGDYMFSKTDVYVLKQKGVLTETDFCESDFKFKETTIMINNSSNKT